MSGHDGGHEDGGPAFPCETPHFSGATVVHKGMSLRDWFAGQALVGYLAAHADPTVKLPLVERAAETCYRYADAMLAESEKAQP